MDVLQLIGRTEKLFTHDLEKYNNRLEEIVRSSSFLIIGGAGTIGQSVAKEIFKRQPLKLHVVDINENNMVELVRDPVSYTHLDVYKRQSMYRAIIFSL